MRHDLLTLDLLLAIAQGQSITRGADSMHMALAAASKRVSDMEARLGVKLFVRKPRGCEPTDACRALLKHVQTVRTALEALDRESMEFSRGIRGTVRIAVARDIEIDGLPLKLADFTRTHSHVRVQLSDCSSAEVEERVVRGDADLGIFVRPAHGSRLREWPYAGGRWTALVPNGHVLLGRPFVTLEDLLGFDIIGAARPEVLAGLTKRAAASGGTREVPLSNASGPDLTAAFVEAGFGIALVPDVTAKRCMTLYRVQSLTMVDVWANYELVVGAAQEKALPVLLRRLVDTLKRPSVPAANAPSANSRVRCPA